MIGKREMQKITITEKEAIKLLNESYIVDYEGDTDRQRINLEKFLISTLEEIHQYREIGTVEECREAVEKQKAKKFVKDKYHHNCCPNCGWIVSGEGGYGEEFCPHCENCGQAIQWKNLEGMEDEQD